MVAGALNPLLGKVARPHTGAASPLQLDTLLSTEQKKSDVFTRIKFSPDLPAQPPTPSRSSAASKPNSSRPRQPRPLRRRAGQRLAHHKHLRHQALLLVSDKDQTFLLSGQGDVIEPDTGIAAIGSGGPFAQAAAQALADHTKLSPREIAEESMKIAGKMCIYTNDKVTIEEL